MKNIELDFSQKIKEKLSNEVGSEEKISKEIWAAEANKGKKLNKPFRTPGGPKKFSVYVKNEKGNVVKVNFGDPNMEIKRDDPNRRKSFRARHNCDNPGPKTKARYWSCKQWRSSTKVQGSGSEAEENLLALMDESESSRPGAKSAAQTPAKPEEKKKGSSKNPPGSAGTKPDAKKTAKNNLNKKDEKSMVSSASITFGEKVTNALKSKVSEHNKKHPSKKVTLGQLKKVYRRGAGAFSSSHRPGMSRGGWAMARVNMYLKMRRGGKVKDSYRKADQDVAKGSSVFLENDGDFGFTMEDEIQAGLDLKIFDILNEKDVDFDWLFSDESDSALTEKQKKLPPAIQKAILKKAGKKPSEKSSKDDKADKEEKKEESDAKKGLWENIRDKKRRMGKNYKPAKPGDKDRPSPEALKKAQESSKKKKY
jgi:hypothetical protein